MCGEVKNEWKYNITAVISLHSIRIRRMHGTCFGFFRQCPVVVLLTTLLVLAGLAITFLIS